MAITFTEAQSVKKNAVLMANRRPEIVTGVERVTRDVINIYYTDKGISVFRT